MKDKPYFPKRAVITAGMPYADKELHCGHIGANILHADIYGRFLRDRIGKDNVVFVSGADCYGAGPVVKHHAAVQDGYEGTLEDFVGKFYRSHQRVLDLYLINFNLYAASGIGEAKDIHHEFSVELFDSWYENGYLRLMESEQFYDEENKTILNGRQVEGKCPFPRCKSNTAYADECELGHQYSPRELLEPKIVTSGKAPVLKSVKNWYFDLERFGAALKERQKELEDEGISRKFLLTNIADFLKDPAILIRTDDFDTLRKATAEMPAHTADINEEGKSATLTFGALKERETACEILRRHGIRFRTGTTLVPFRISGDVEWGIPLPEREGLDDQTIWCWPESLWAPMSFLKTVLTRSGEGDSWEKWWFDEDARVYQFIGEDNIYFYAVAGMGLFMALNEIAGRPALFSLPQVIPNRHLHYGKSKMASSGPNKAPTAEELLEYYTAEQLRMHFAHMALHNNAIPLKPKALLREDGFDATLAEGNILTNVFNRLIRSCFYSMQKHFDGKLPDVEVSEEVRAAADKMISDYEWAMYRFEFPKIIDLLDVYLRDSNKAWSAKIKEADANDDDALRAQTLVDAFHVVRVASTLLHPFAPEGTERVREFLNVDESLWDWTFIEKALPHFMGQSHEFKFLEPRVDFFHKHPSQLSARA